MSTGLDSIAATALSTRLGERFNTALSQTLLFDHPSLRSIAGSLSLDRASSSTWTCRRIEAHETESSRAGSARPRSVEQQVPAVVDAISAVFLEIQGTVAAVDASLVTAGMDSIAMTELATMLAKQVDTELPQTLLFDYPTIGAVASFVATTTSS